MKEPIMQRFSMEQVDASWLGMLASLAMTH
jgi:hypothetical protein